MKSYALQSPRRARLRPGHARVPAFSPVPLRRRTDGWTPMRQAAFLAALAATGSVSAAARRVGMARETVYRLRRRADAGSFAASWDAVLGRVRTLRRKVTGGERSQRALYGLLKPVLYRGTHVGTVHKADNSALLGHLALLDRNLLSCHDAEAGPASFTPCSVSTSPPFPSVIPDLFRDPALFYADGAGTSTPEPVRGGMDAAGTDGC